MAVVVLRNRETDVVLRDGSILHVRPASPAGEASVVVTNIGQDRLFATLPVALDAFERRRETAPSSAGRTPTSHE